MGEVIKRIKSFDNGSNHPYYEKVVSRLELDSEPHLSISQDMDRCYEGLYFKRELLLQAFESFICEKNGMYLGSPIIFISCVHKYENLPHTLISCNFIVEETLHVFTYVIEKNQNMGAVCDSIATLFEAAKRV